MKWDYHLRRGYRIGRWVYGFERYDVPFDPGFYFVDITIRIPLVWPRIWRAGSF